VSAAKTAETIKLPFAFRTRAGPMNHVLHEVQMPTWEGAILMGNKQTICSFDCGLEWAEGCTSSIVFARWRQCALVEGHVAVTCRITLNHPCTAAMRIMANYFDHLLFLDTPTYTVAQTAKRFEPSTVLWVFHTMQPSSLS